ncbi:uncharacterized protein LOC110189127 [Drosophila serrata]|uniref:uncharacterized protein LOC110189127 n=1 Tax=Drosophila serrata TaxID=7274 RepID=UPI000A1D3936|nr:uncharacterized protein LOC110189127 [Drosophila serrata]
MPQIPTWVCIAQHESSFNTAAVGRLNADGSADHGLFQISDLFWCTHDQRPGKGCQATCNQFLDSNIVDDVQCIRRIHQEHTQISGDGFNAWTVYKRNCLNQHYEQVAACFAKPPAPQHHPHHHLHPNAIGGGPVKPKVSYAYQFGQVQVQQQSPAPAVNQYYRPATSFVSHQQGEVTNVAAYQGNPFLRPRLPTAPVVVAAPSPPRQHPNAIGGGFKGQTPANPFYYKQQQTHYQPHYQAHYQTHYQQQYHTTANKVAHTGKVYNRCELAQELYFSHKFPMQELATWVCIAEHESSFNTAAVGRLNADGSADHGLFQISDLYWCTHDQGAGGKGCHIDCNRLLDSDISDDVKCVRTIHEEHTRISGDGFTAWTVYNLHCRQKTRADIASCFEGKDVTQTGIKPSTGNELVKKAPSKPKGKIYSRCELAKELYHKHKLPMKEIPTWVCIAQHESSFNTAAVGRLNSDGSEDHGLFQISDIYWCSHDQTSGKACHIECDRLLDSDISDDVQCIRTIHEEHTRLSGDGFNAWTVYNGHCRGQSLAQLSDCFEGNEIAEADKISPHGEKPQVKPHQLNSEKPVHRIATSPGYSGNPFLQNLKAAKAPQTHVPPTKVTNKISNSSPKQPPSNKLYATNPFLNSLQGQKNSSPNVVKYEATPTQASTISYTQKPNYDHNPFLKAPGSIPHSVISSHTTEETKPHDSFSYAQNPFLSLLSKPIVPAQAPIKSQPKPKPSSSSPSKPPQTVNRPYVSSDSFRNEVIKFTATSTAATTTSSTRQPISTTSITKPSVTTTTGRPLTLATKKPVSTTAKTTKLPLWSWQTSVGKTTTTSKPTITGSGSRYTATTKASAYATPTRSHNFSTNNSSNYSSNYSHNNSSNYSYNNSSNYSSNYTPITTSRPKTTARYTTTTTKSSTRYAGVYLPTTRPISTTKSTPRYAPTTRSTTKSPYHYIQVNKSKKSSTPTTRSTTTTRRPPTTTQKPAITRSTTRFPAPTTRQGSTTPRPYLFTSTTTTKKSATTKDPFDHPFFQKYKAKFDKTTIAPPQKSKTTSTFVSNPSNSTTSSPYYAKYQENKIKTAAKTVLSYDFGQNRTTTIRPKSAFDVYLNWNKN